MPVRVSTVSFVPLLINRFSHIISPCPHLTLMAMDEHQIQEGVEILLVASCDGNCYKLRPDGPLGSCADLTCYLKLPSL